MELPTFVTNYRVFCFKNYGLFKISFFPSTFKKALSSKTIELDHLKAEWTAKMNDLAAKHKHEMATEKEKAIQVNKITLMSVVEKRIPSYFEDVFLVEMNLFFLF